jgi:hypothetical protein
MPSGKFCGSPALRRRSYCYFHMEQYRRQRRSRARKIIAGIREAQHQRRLRAECVLKTPVLKDLVLKFFDEAALRDIFGLSPDGKSICHVQGEGGISDAAPGLE